MLSVLCVCVAYSNYFNRSTEKIAVTRRHLEIALKCSRTNKSLKSHRLVLAECYVTISHNRYYTQRVLFVNRDSDRDLHADFDFALNKHM